MLRCLRRPFPLVAALLLPLVILSSPLDRTQRLLLRARKVHADDRDFGTSAYLNPIKVMTVKNLLGSGVLRLYLAAALGLLSGDDRVAATGRLLETFAIKEADAASNELNQGAVL
jgi:hypothetical protein